MLMPNEAREPIAGLIPILPGNAPRRYAETFFDLPLPDYIDLCASYFRPPAGAAYLKPAYRA